jgi:predicted glycosyltransferase
MPDIQILSITGSSLAESFFEHNTHNHDYIKLPGLNKIGPDLYQARNLPIEFAEIISMRQKIIEKAVLSFLPDLIIVDKSPRGLGNELVHALEMLRVQSPGTRIVLGLRDILDDPGVIRPMWQSREFTRWVSEIYSDIWIWGEQQVYDAVKAYGFPEDIARKTRYLGYIPPDQMQTNPMKIRKKAGIESTQQRLLLITAGGGSDALPIFLKVIEGLLAANEPMVQTLLVSGPLMPEEDFHQLRTSLRPHREKIRLVRFLKNFGDWLRAADAVISMGGYNTMTEVASIGKPSLVIPRIYPRREQYERAETFARHGWCKTVGVEDDVVARVTNFCQRMAYDDLQRSLTMLHCKGFSSLLDEIRKMKTREASHATHHDLTT